MITDRLGQIVTAGLGVEFCDWKCARTLLTLHLVAVLLDDSKVKWKMVYADNGFIRSAIDDFNWDNEVNEVYEMIEFGSGWLTANDPVFWCLAPAHLEEVVWLFRRAPIRQPRDYWGNPITLLKYFLRMDFSELLYSLWLAPRKIREALCMLWTRVTTRCDLSTQNCLNQEMGPELDWLFKRNPDLPPSWEVTLSPPSGGVRHYRVAFPEWLTEETEL